MGYGNNFDSGNHFAEDDEEGESVEEIAPSAAQVRRPLLGRLFDLLNRFVKLRHESFGGLAVPRQIPLAATLASWMASGWSHGGSTATIVQVFGDAPQATGLA